MIIFQIHCSGFDWLKLTEVYFDRPLLLKFLNILFLWTALWNCYQKVRCLTRFAFLSAKSFAPLFFQLMKRVWWIQFVKPSSDIERTLILLKNYMFILVPFSLLILAIDGNFMARNLFSRLKKTAIKLIEFMRRIFPSEFKQSFRTKTATWLFDFFNLFLIHRVAGLKRNRW